MARSNKHISVFLRLKCITADELQNAEPTIFDSRCVPVSPLSSVLVVLVTVVLVNLRDVGCERVVRVGVRQERADRQKDLVHGEGG